ncbi:MAG: glycosyltransferase family 9 protein [Rhodospirillales bacterium]|nr:glycosyltransferase family 9 protein [Rhodospirillales bacterium]
MKLLFITSTRIGDAVLSTGLLDHLVRQHPQARVTVACGPEAAPLFAALPNLERLIPMAKERWSGHWFTLWKECVGIHWDIVVDLRRSAVAYLLSTDRRYMLRRSGEPVHRVREIADALDLPEPPMPRIWISDAERQAARRLMPSDRPILAVGPTTNWRAKTWRAERFLELIRRLTGPSGILPEARVAIFGAPDERAQAMPVIEGLEPDRRLDLVGKIDLLTVYACLERCGFYVGNDSALMHLAAASGIPTLGLFGPSQETHYAPWGWHAAAVRTRTEFGKLFPPNFDHKTSDTLMDTLTVEDAEAAARALWAKLERRAA